jgi:hypothetical protein
LSFLNIWALSIAAVVVPALLILYFLKLRRREEPVASTLLWKRAVQDLQVNAPFQRLRKNLLLFLQLLVLAAAIIALARPIVQSSGAVEGRLVILIDRSASMNTKEAEGTRLDLAKEQATRLVKTVNRRNESWLSFFKLGGAQTKTQVMVVAFADRATVVSPFTPNAADLVDQIRAIEPTDGLTNIKEAVALAEAHAAPPTMLSPGLEGAPVSTEPPAKVLLLSDGAVADIDQVVRREGTIQLIKIGQTRDNVGITALRTQRNYEKPEILDVFLQVQNFGDQPVSVDLSLFVDGEMSAAPVQTIELAAAESPPGEKSGSGGVPETAPSTGSTQGLSVPLVLERAAVLEARLSRDDALMADNRAYAIVPPPRKLRVLVVTDKNFFLDSVLRGLPLEERVFLTPAQYEAAPEGEIETDGRSKYDVVIFDKVRTKRLPIGNYLFIGAIPEIEEIGVTEEVEQSQVLVWWDETHPVLRHVSLDYVYVGKMLILKLPSQAQTLIEGPRGPALARYAKDGRHYMILAFAVENSTWWEKPSFPVFAYNVLRYLGSGGAEVEQGPVRPGDTLRIPLPEGVTQATLTRPDDTTVTVEPDAAGMVYYGGARQVGVYRVSYGSGDSAKKDSYAVNLEDPWESDIRPRGAEDLRSPQITAGKAIETATPEVWRWFVGAALLIALFEWYIYNRRVMI